MRLPAGSPFFVVRVLLSAILHPQIEYYILPVDTPHASIKDNESKIRIKDLTSDLTFTIIISDSEVTLLCVEVCYGERYKRKNT